MPGHVVYNRIRNALELLQKKHGKGVAVDMVALAAFLTELGGGSRWGSRGTRRV